MSTPTLNSSWTPPLGPDVLYNEYTWFAGIFVQSIGYGIIVVLAVQSELFLYKSINARNMRNKLAWMTVVFILFVCATVCAVADEKMGEWSFINYRNYPGGPSAFELDFNALPINAVANVFVIIGDLICVGVQLWRCYVLYSSSRPLMWIIMALPSLAFLTSIVLGILVAIEVVHSTLFATTGINWATPYLILTLTLNVFISAALVLRLLTYRWRIRRVGIDSYTIGGVDYFGIAAMISESTIIYAAFSLVSLVLFVKNNVVQNVFDPLFVMAEIIATLLILYRVASGSAWSSDTSSKLFGTQSSFSEDGRRIELKNMSTYNPSNLKFGSTGDTITLTSVVAEPLATSL